MMYASEIGSIELAKCLAKHGGNVDDIHQEETPLRITIHRCYVYMTKWLLENGSQQAQMTLLSVIQLQNIEMCRLLLAHGASVLDLELVTSQMKTEIKGLIIDAYLKAEWYSSKRIEKKQATIWRTRWSTWRRNTGSK